MKTNGYIPSISSSRSIGGALKLLNSHSKNVVRSHSTTPLQKSLISKDTVRRSSIQLSAFNDDTKTDTAGPSDESFSESSNSICQVSRISEKQDEPFYFLPRTSSKSSTTSSPDLHLRSLLNKSTTTTSFVNKQRSSQHSHTVQPTTSIININLTQNVINKEKKEFQKKFNVELDDLLLIEEKLAEILTNLRSFKQNNKSICEWWNIINLSDYHNKIFYFFLVNLKENEPGKKILLDGSLLEFISIIICYDLNIDVGLFGVTINLLKNLFYILHQNFLIMCDVILEFFAEKSMTSIWYNKLQSIVANKISKRIKKGEHFYLMKQNNENITSSLKNIFRTCNGKGSIIAQAHQYFKNFSKLTIGTLNDFFMGVIINKSSYLLNGGDGLPNVSVPYITVPSEKEFTLVLDLDETLVYIEICKRSNKKIIINLRPHLFTFLEEVSKYYELIVFTAALKDYADPIIDFINSQGGRNYFSYRLYREHAVMMNGELVKDLSKLGRNLSKMIIVDNLAQNFKLQKDNGILIKSFDKNTDPKKDFILSDLAIILNDIAKLHLKDIRKALISYKSQIASKITEI